MACKTMKSIPSIIAPDVEYHTRQKKKGATEVAPSLGGGI
jgi:hypothetical protein